MTQTVVQYDTSTGEIEDIDIVVGNERELSTNELDAENHGVSPGELDSMRVDTSGAEPKLVKKSDYEWRRPGVIDSETRDLIAEKFRAAGANAIQAEQNNNPAAFMVAVIQMEYLNYVALTGDRIESVEDSYFPV